METRPRSPLRDTSDRNKSWTWPCPCLTSPQTGGGGVSCGADTAVVFPCLKYVPGTSVLELKPYGGG